MAITKAQLEAAKTHQHTAAHDSSPQVRLVAGPGSGKSFTIAERVLHLLTDPGQPIPPDQICVVSFTRAASRDLAEGVSSYCKEQGCTEGAKVSVGTLHSLALRMLRKADLLALYPVSPLVLDTWEVRNVYETEFGECAQINKADRRAQIRQHHEAFWSTGSWGPPNYIPPDPPISEEEAAAFRTFHHQRSKLFASVLPGEVVRKAVESMDAGLMDPAQLLGVRHLIIDEFQDLNPMDVELVDALVKRVVATFIAGDDDQSLYSFRFADPRGIQEFVKNHPACSDRPLHDCFRCTPNILAAATSRIDANATPARIPKHLTSVYASSQPVVTGVIKRLTFYTDKQEAQFVAESCKGLVAAGLAASRIMILLANPRRQQSLLVKALTAAGVLFSLPREASILDESVGRAAHAIIRIACSGQDDYVAHQVLLGTLNGRRPGAGRARSGRGGACATWRA